jgi:hypothetical protein
VRRSSPDALVDFDAPIEDPERARAVLISIARPARDRQTVAS